MMIDEAIEYEDKSTVAGTSKFEHVTVVEDNDSNRSERRKSSEGD